MNEWRSSADLSCIDMVLVSKTTFVLSFHQIVVQHIHLNTKPLEPNNVVLATNISTIQISRGSSAQINYIAMNNKVNSKTVQYFMKQCFKFLCFSFLTTKIMWFATSFGLTIKTWKGKKEKNL